MKNCKTSENVFSFEVNKILGNGNLFRNCCHGGHRNSDSKMKFMLETVCEVKTQNVSVLVVIATTDSPYTNSLT